MKILHTSDWHLGKTLEGRSRIIEQKEFIDELAEIAEREKPDLIIVAGDIYDSSNPPSAAEQLFYRAMTRLSNYGSRPTLVIAGNHDNPDRLTAASPLAYEWGIILLGSAKNIAECGDYRNYSITAAAEGSIEICLNGEKLVAIILPYPSERRLDEIMFEPENMQKSYSEKVTALFDRLSAYYREDTINIAVGHFFINGGEITDSERDISIGGAYAVEAKGLPKAQYIAMGHLHRPQRIKNADGFVYYSGSPIQYSKSEIGYEKSVYLVEIKPGLTPDIRKVPLRVYKPVVTVKFGSVEEALSSLEKIPVDAWVYVEITSKRTLAQWEIKEIKERSADIVEIKTTVIDDGESEEFILSDDDIPITEAFDLFYKDARGVMPPDDLKRLFLRLIEEETSDETDRA